MSSSQTKEQDDIDAKIKARLDSFGALAGKYVYGQTLVD